MQLEEIEKETDPETKERLQRFVSTLREQGEHTIDHEVWIGQDDYLVRQSKHINSHKAGFVRYGDVTVSSETRITITSGMKLADINQALTIEPPEDAIPLGEAIRCPSKEDQAAPQTTSACYDVRSELDSLELVGIIEPAPGTQLQVGASVRVRVAVRYVSDSHDEMAIVLMRSKLESGITSIKSVLVFKGSDTVIMDGMFEVPDLSEVQISVALFPPFSVVQAAGYDCWSKSITIVVGTYETS